MDLWKQGNVSQTLAALINASWNATTNAATVNVRRLAIHMLKRGPIPRHVAFIMDGNRRWAKNWAVQPGLGHIMGFKTMEQTLDWCHDLGIKCVSVYAFSIENFKRPVEEVDVLMDLARKKFEEFCMEG
jgi:ditrans,polycis-polyprenyl diphosphate synthase